MYIRVKKSYLECYSKSFTLYSKKLLELVEQYPALSMISVERVIFNISFNSQLLQCNQDKSRLKKLVESRLKKLVESILNKLVETQ